MKIIKQNKDMLRNGDRARKDTTSKYLYFLSPWGLISKEHAACRLNQRHPMICENLNLYRSKGGA